jgi:hypothetical protein
MKKEGWVGVDLDGVLAHYDGWRGHNHIGQVIPSVLIRVKALIAVGVEVRIFTARACISHQIPPVKRWLKRHGLGKLKVTCKKDIGCVELWDDRCIQYVSNTGIRVEDFAARHVKKMIEVYRRNVRVFDTYSAAYIGKARKTKGKG